MRVLLFVLFALTACSPTPYTEGVPNYAHVQVGFYRSGQPTTLQQWQAIYRDLERDAPGRSHVVVKLNFDDEGSDALALAAGFTVLRLPIEPAGDRNVFDNVLNTFVQPSASELHAIDQALEEHLLDGEVLHCTHGEDRTGVGVLRFRVLHGGWTYERAYAEALKYHFHPELHGLHESLETFAQAHR